jgi:hypothetical protein
MQDRIGNRKERKAKTCAFAASMLAFSLPALAQPTATPDAPAAAYPAPPGRAAGTVRLEAIQSFFPDTPRRFACRMRLVAVNEGRSRVEFAPVVVTAGEDGETADTWLVPFGPLEPGKAAERMFSCRRMVSVRLAAENRHGWPERCAVDGEAAAPCPVGVELRAVFGEPYAAAAGVRPRR